MTFVRTLWTKKARDEFNRLRRAGLSRGLIADRLGFTRQQIKNYFDRERREHVLSDFISRAPAEVLAERDVRLSVPRDHPCFLLGDPVPGRSALDQKRSGKNAPL